EPPRRESRARTLTPGSWPSGRTRTRRSSWRSWCSTAVVSAATRLERPWPAPSRRRLSRRRCMADESGGELSEQVRVLGGRYRMESLLGQGGMAQVYKGTDTVLGRPVAIKILAPQYAKDQSFVDRFRREAQSAARLNHPNVVGVYDTGSDDGSHYIVMEFVEGRTLADFLSSGGSLLPERAVELASSVCVALSGAHQAGIAHRDIKPGKLMVTPGGEVKVMDFGIARAATAETVTATATVLGTASYLSPEQAQGK